MDEQSVKSPSKSPIIPSRKSPGYEKLTEILQKIRKARDSSNEHDDFIVIYASDAAN